MTHLVLTQYRTHKRFSLHPCTWIISAPRKTLIDLGKPAPRQTALISVYNSSLILLVEEPYADIKKQIKARYSEFVEFIHRETGTNFLLDPSLFSLHESGVITPGFEAPVDTTCLVSIVNPLLTVPITETWDEACAKLLSE